MADAEEKWRKCAFCERRFTKVEHLKRHQRSHTGEKPFKCPKCDQRYARSDVLARHIQNHPRRMYRSRVTKPVPITGTNQQSTSTSVDDIQRDRNSQQAGIVAPLTAINNPDSDAGVQDNTSSTSNSPVDAIYEHISTSNIVLPVDEWLSAPTKRVNGKGERLFVPQQMEESNACHRPVAEDSPNYDSSSFRHYAPLLDQSIVHSWPLSTTLYPCYDLSDIDLNVAFTGANALFGSTGQTLEEGPSPNGSPREPLGLDSLKRIEQMWSGKGISQPALLVWTLWDDVTEHKAANILSDPAEHVNLPSNHPSEHRSEYGMNSKITEQCRERLLVFHSQTQTPPGIAPASNVLSPSKTQQSELSSSPATGPCLPDLSDVEFPSLEVLDLSLKFYFRHVHLSLPFIHRPTFNASETPCLLLLPMILIGFSILDPYGSKAFVSRYQAYLIELCRADLACKARGKSGSPSGLIRSLASSLLVLYLNLENRNHEEAAFMLCAQTLHIAEKHGLYEMHHKQDLIANLLTKSSDSESYWMLWARIESIKMLVLCLVRMDTAYARLMGTNGVIDPNQVNVILPVNSVLFNSPNADKFVEDAKMATAVPMPVIHMRHFAESAPKSGVMNGFLLRVVLDHIHIRVSSAQVRVFSAADDNVPQICDFALANLYNRSAEAKDINHQLVAISRNYASLLQPPADPLSPLAWNYLCMIVSAPVEQLELAIGRRGPQCAPKSRAAIEVWSKSPVARRAVLHAAQICYILTFGAHPPLSSAEKKLLRVESMVFTSALVLGLYFSTERTSIPSPRLAEDSNPPSALELLQDIDWAIVNGEGFAEDCDWPMALHNTERSTSAQFAGVQAREFIRHGQLSLSFDGKSQLQGVKMAASVFQEYAYILDQLGGSGESHGSGSDFANIARSVSDILAS
ncbi:hypothetical protein N7444_011093 [Penicillium canescens]|nr:hypothetical protein N7444_011093 [Penicillium canescens]